MLETPRITSADWGSMTWLADGEEKDVALARMKVLPEATSPAHFHHDANEIIHLFRGHIRQRRDDEWIEMTPGSSIFIPAGIVHQSENLSQEEAILFIAYSNGARSYEEVPT